MQKTQEIKNLTQLKKLGQAFIKACRIGQQEIFEGRSLVERKLFFSLDVKDSTKIKTESPVLNTFLLNDFFFKSSASVTSELNNKLGTKTWKTIGDQIVTVKDYDKKSIKDDITEFCNFINTINSRKPNIRHSDKKKKALKFKQFKKKIKDWYSEDIDIDEDDLKEFLLHILNGVYHNPGHLKVRGGIFQVDVLNSLELKEKLLEVFRILFSTKGKIWEEIEESFNNMEGGLYRLLKNNTLITFYLQFNKIFTESFSMESGILAGEDVKDYIGTGMDYGFRIIENASENNIIISPSVVKDVLCIYCDCVGGSCDCGAAKGYYITKDKGKKLIFCYNGDKNLKGYPETTPMFSVKLNNYANRKKIENLLAKRVRPTLLCFREQCKEFNGPYHFSFDTISSNFR